MQTICLLCVDMQLGTLIDPYMHAQRHGLHVYDVFTLINWWKSMYVNSCLLLVVNSFYEHLVTSNIFRSVLYVCCLYTRCFSALQQSDVLCPTQLSFTFLKWIDVRTFARINGMITANEQDFVCIKTYQR